MTITIRDAQLSVENGGFHDKAIFVEAVPRVGEFIRLLGLSTQFQVKRVVHEEFPSHGNLRVVVEV